MSTPSAWPLGSDALRITLPRFLVAQLAAHPLAADVHPHAFGHYPRAQGHRMQRERHDDLLVIWCTAGSGSVSAGGDSNLRVGPGTLIVLPPGLAHRYAADRRQPWTLYWAHVGGHALPELAALLSPSGRVTVEIGLDANLLRDFTALLAVRDTGYRLDTWLHAGSLLKQWLLHAARLGARGPGDDTAFSLDRVTAWMHAHIEQPVELADMASATSSLSLFQFARRFKAETGVAPIQYFIHLRMEHACRLLDMSDAPVHRIARQLGYDDPYYFSRLFRKVIGVAPSDYRQQARG
ncbi:MAG: helix-turn-helix domain-containing protein [Pseudomonadota bacterium]